uniref:Formyl peptide receptor 1 n=1 Tax=Amphilophus citrinellus TaxID=61819 RepID=A0A3Q0R160_AMPCI
MAKTLPKSPYTELIQSLTTMSIVVYSVVSVLGVLGNGVVIWVTGFKMKKTVNTVWYLNLAVADFVFSAFLPLTVAYLALGSHWPFGKFMCKLNSIIGFLNMFASVYILVVISVDTCVSVVLPIWAKNHRNVRKASWVSLGVWVVATNLSAPYFFFMDTKQMSEDKIICFNSLFKNGTQSHNRFHLQAMILTRFLLGFAIPFTAIVSCYAVIIHHLRKKRSLGRQSSRPFKIIAAIIITFFLCWAPYQIMGLFKWLIFTADTVNKTLHHVFDIGSSFTAGLTVLSSCINPLLYVFIRQDFKDEFRKSILSVLETAFREEETHSPTEHQTDQIEL